MGRRAFSEQFDTGMHGAPTYGHNPSFLRQRHLMIRQAASPASGAEEGERQ